MTRRDEDRIAAGQTENQANERAAATSLAVQRADRSLTEDAEALRSSRYSQILEAHGAGIARVAGNYARSAAEREDLVQEVSLAIWGALPRFRGEASLRTFAFRIAHNCSITHLRKRRAMVPEQEIVDLQPSAQQLLEQRSDRQRLMRAIQSLPVGLREVLTLKLEGLSYLQIGEIVGISEKNVSVRLTRARQRLRRALGEER
jgi:RNA polymerase sigma-70 factor (ECF subfamily)